MVELKEAAFKFLDIIFNHLHDDELLVDQLEMDHICYRVETFAAYRKFKSELSQFATLFHESIVGGRPISIFRLNEKWKYHSRLIEYIELPAPKQNKFYPEGWEHAEFVIDSNLTAFQKRYPNVPFVKKGLAKDVNAEIKIIYKPYAVKFHCLPIYKVIELESKLSNKKL